MKRKLTPPSGNNNNTCVGSCSVPQRACRPDGQPACRGITMHDQRFMDGILCSPFICVSKSDECIVSNMLPSHVQILCMALAAVFKTCPWPHAVTRLLDMERRLLMRWGHNAYRPRRKKAAYRQCSSTCAAICTLLDVDARTVHSSSSVQLYEFWLSNDSNKSHMTFSLC